MRRHPGSSHQLKVAALLTIWASLTLAVLGCGPAGATPSAGPATIAPTPRAPDVPVSTRPPVTDVPVPILETVQAEAARLAGRAADQLTLVRADAIVWPDGSLGCPKPGEMYTQALVNGYWIVFESGSETFDFRLMSDGSFQRCELRAPGHPT